MNSYLYSAFFESEKNYARAESITKKMLDEKQRLYYSDYILDEILTLARKRNGAEISNSVLDDLFSGNEIELIIASEKNIVAAVEIFRKFETLLRNTAS